MDLRTALLDEQDQNFIDSAVECGEMSAHTSVTLDLYGDPQQIRDAILRKPADTTDWEFNWRHARRVTVERLDAVAEGIIAALPAERRAALSAMGSLHLHYLMREHARYLAGSLYEDMTTGGCQWDYHQERCDYRTQEAAKKTKRKLMAPGYIRYRIANYSDETWFLRNGAARFFKAALKHLHSIPVSVIIEEIDAVHDDLDKVRGLIRRSLPKAAPELPYRVVRAETRKNRKITRRAAVMAAGLLGASTVSAFARGETVVLPGSECALAVSRQGHLHSQGHGQLHVTVRSLDGKDLADLCVYIDKTPALDQLTAFALHAQAGIENEIIDAANIIRTHPAGIDHAVLSRHKKRAEAARVDGGPIRFPTRWQQQRERQDEYWTATKDVWLRELSVFVFGPQEKLMRTLRHLAKDKT